MLTQQKKTPIVVAKTVRNNPGIRISNFRGKRRSEEIELNIKQTEAGNKRSRLRRPSPNASPVPGTTVPRCTRPYSRTGSLLAVQFVLNEQREAYTNKNGCHF